MSPLMVPSDGEAEISNTRVIYKNIHQTHINQFVNMMLDYYRIWIKYFYWERTADF